MLTFHPTVAPKGRIHAVLGQHRIGVIHPDPWRWTLDLPGERVEKSARSEFAARVAMTVAAEEWIRRAGLMPVAAARPETERTAD